MMQRKNAKIQFFSFRALDDILESIKELQYYRTNMFQTTTEEKKRKIVENGDCNKS